MGFIVVNDKLRPLILENLVIARKDSAQFLNPNDYEPLTFDSIESDALNQFNLTSGVFTPIETGVYDFKLQTTLESTSILNYLVIMQKRIGANFQDYLVQSYDYQSVIDSFNAHVMTGFVFLEANQEMRFVVSGGSGVIMAADLFIIRIK